MVAIGLIAIVLTAGTVAPPPGAVLRFVDTSTTLPSKPAPPTTIPDIAPIGPLETEIATSAVTQIVVYEQIPEDVPDGAPEVVRMADLPAVAFTSERDGAPEIPSAVQAVQGRGRTESGWVFDNPTPWGNPLTFAVTERRGAWVRVLLPVRPNGTQGWIRYADVNVSVIDTRVHVDLTARTLAAYKGDQLLAQTQIVIGASRSPTPTGRYFITDYDPKYRGSAYGPWVLPLSGFSQAMDSFGGGVPVIAMHGTNRPELVGGAHSNGCLRMPDDTIDLLRMAMPLGTPVDIVG